MTAFLNDLLEAIWPKRWCLVRKTVAGTLLVTSMHRTSAAATMEITDPLSEEVIHLDNLFGETYFVGELR